ncbi:23S rRNA accumulation protein YceD [Vibrio breoganii]|uniref:Large ribosomal RNA subunit accumulation protein YceD n=1 Tax=Vibrio breoganii TaxID=553239 RepID=A0AAJ3SDQ6_9VIBR|nr:23S rRNA accumulation protein YceD [Vibrio breoganii]ANO33319.1 ribosomal protein L32p [Vibrio breoganii]MDN3716710.1 23S rRNA accumulation protein YceD [Vibrio breoganii]NMO72632.1 23S rRNA accumulation protein YceD [Vibrio breoganii]NMR69029.1 23S rRNA accumulation protein YceD [Vibrio breoganii]OCH76221.1 ribosomal protein L32p [Vibrio breoganii]
MQKVKIPRTVDPSKAAQKRLDYDGIIQVSLLKRLAESVEGVKRDAEVTLSFDLDEQRLVVISGKANVEVDLECQRCNENFTHVCEVQFVYTPNKGEKTEEEAPEEYDLVDLNEYGECDLIQLVEDEFLLNLPQIAMHDVSDCSVNTHNLVFGDIPEEIEEDKPNPFEVLKSLKAKTKE